MNSTLDVRTASLADSREMAALLNEIIAKGGTTALTSPVSASDLAQWIQHHPDRSAWHVARGDDGDLLGFQWIGPHTDLPAEACDIATFVRVGSAGLGIGSALFHRTRNAAEALGYAWINANIRADNEGGLIYYQSRGFRDWKRIERVALADGSIVAKVFKRFDLRD